MLQVSQAKCVFAPNNLVGNPWEEGTFNMTLSRWISSFKSDIVAGGGGVAAGSLISQVNLRRKRETKRERERDGERERERDRERER